MRKSADEKAKSRQRIIDTAARRIRESGLDQPGVAEIMRSAGMTHGGFYKHFDSRDELLVAAVDRALTGTSGTVSQLLEEADDPLAAFVDWYLSTDHVADPGHGCGVAALGGDVGRAGGQVQVTYRAQVERYLAMLERLLGTRTQATVALSTLTGTIVLARALGSDPLAEELLRDVRAALKRRSADSFDMPHDSGRDDLGG